MGLPQTIFCTVRCSQLCITIPLPLRKPLPTGQWGAQCTGPPVSGGGGGVGHSRLNPSGSWTAAKKRTWPVCPWPRPAGLRVARGQLTVPGEAGMVSTTPALVPTQSSSSHTSSAVIRRHAALCCRMMASEPGGGWGNGPELRGNQTLARVPASSRKRPKRTQGSQGWWWWWF